MFFRIKTKFRSPIALFSNLAKFKDGIQDAIKQEVHGFFSCGRHGHFDDGAIKYKALVQINESIETWKKDTNGSQVVLNDELKLKTSYLLFRYATPHEKRQLKSRKLFKQILEACDELQALFGMHFKNRCHKLLQFLYETTGINHDRIISQRRFSIPETSKKMKIAFSCQDPLTIMECINYFDVDDLDRMENFIKIKENLEASAEKKEPVLALFVVEHIFKDIRGHVRERLTGSNIFFIEISEEDYEDGEDDVEEDEDQ